MSLIVDLPDMCKSCAELELCTGECYDTRGNLALKYSTCRKALECKWLDDAILEEEEHERTNS